MTERIDDVRIETIEEVITPEQLMREIPINTSVKRLVFLSRNTVSSILRRKDKRLLVIVGPCSIHDTRSALEYAEKLALLSKLHTKNLEIIMRVYFEKPRTTIGWKGLINDPDLDASNNINKGLKLARKLLLDISDLGLPAATEFLDPITPQYIGDLISWGAIGARTTESQIHRQLASGLSAPIGFKNSTDGSVQVAIDAIRSASNSHRFLSVTKKGNSAIVSTSGNKDCHIIHRGGVNGTNYAKEYVATTEELLRKNDIDTGIMIDLSHANSNKNFKDQISAGASVGRQISEGNTNIVGIMIESNLIEGNQSITGDPNSLTYGQSITDACLGWDATSNLIDHIGRAVEQRKINDHS